MSPLFCCVANRPSSDPVRRVKARDLRRLLEDRLDLLQTRSVSSSAIPAGVQVVDDESAFVGRRQEAGADAA